MGRLTERVVIITGATGGLGRAVVRAFLAEGAVVWGVLEPSVSSPFPETAFRGIPADLFTSEGAAAAVREVIGSAGRIDALIHLVGGFAGGKPVAETDDQTWRRMFDLNFQSSLFTIRAVLPHMLKAGQGRIVAIGTRTAVEPAANLSAYGVSKAALVALIRTIAAEVRNSGVTANVILPSVIDTPANRAGNAGADFSKWVKPESIAELLVYLASDAAADVNGATIPIYGRA